MSDNIIGIAGLGFLGRGIVACLAAYGHRVIAFDRTPESRRETEAYVDQAMRELVANAHFAATLVEGWRDRVVFADDVRDLSPATFVIESVTEDVAVKSEFFDQLEGCISAETPVATNTSSLPVSTVAAHRKFPTRFLGMHWAEPAYATRFIELIRGEQTSDEAFQIAVSLAQQCGKEPSIVKKDIPAFVANRIGYAMFREALNLLELGVADVDTIDRSFRNSVGLWASFAGPFRWIDLTGGPMLYGKTMSNVLPTLSNAQEISPRMRAMMEAGDRGVTNHRGFYAYTDEDVEKWEECFRRTVWKVREWTEELATGDESCRSDTER
jgi:3-hydroxybutyryl-CoA dehydrogenase